VKVTSVTVTPGTLALTPGATGQLAASVAPTDAADTRVMWSIAPTSVATINADGLVTAVATGEATATATTADGGKTATAAVTVTAKAVAVTGVSLNKTTLALTAGASETLTATVAPGDATNKAVTWKSSKPDVATVDATGKVTAVAAGTAVITATTVDGAKTADAAVTVKAAYTVTFDTDGGSGAPTAQTVADGEKAVAVTDPTKAFTKREGLYLLPLPANDKFDGWYAGDTKWDFATSVVTADVTLKARWTTDAKLNVTLNPRYLSEVYQYVSYAKNNAASGKRFILLLEKSEKVPALVIDAANFDLTIEGVGGERTLTAGGNSIIPSRPTVFDTEGHLIEITVASATLTLGENITLRGKANPLADDNYRMANIPAGHLVMKPGSKITGHKLDFGTIALEVYAVTVLTGGKFTMEGGEISGNEATASFMAGAVFVAKDGVFTVSGGKITGNTYTGFNTDVGTDVFVNVGGTTNLKGTAEIDGIMLFWNNDANSSVTVTGAFTGKVGALDLISSSDDYWKDKQLITGAGYTLTTGDVAKFTLGKFIHLESEAVNISDKYRFSEATPGKLVEK
jgi:hypothetical protein